MKSNRPSSYQKFKSSLSALIGLLVPGVGIKRWLVIILLGTTLIGFGLAVLVLEVYRTAPETWWLPLISTASLRFLPRYLRALVFGLLGLGLILLGIRELNRSIMTPFIRPGRKVVDTLRTHRQRKRGPNIVAVGGGNGLATLLRGLKNYTHNITAVVTVADDGGSSGRLRKDLGILPPGDIRNCLAALSSDEALLGQLFQYRFANGNTGLDGHSFGNLFITALAEITGSFEEAVAESGRVLAVHGRVIPSTIHNVRLVADMALPFAVSEIRVEGESQIPESTGKIHRVWLEPSNSPAFPEAIQSILNADLIIIGPGSLYTSILPNLLVQDLSDAIQASKAVKFYICNVATQYGETEGFTCRDHLHTLEAHIKTDLFDVVIVNDNFTGSLPEEIEWVIPETGLINDYPIYQADLLDMLHPWRHDSKKLAQVILDLYQERTGPLV